MVNTPQKAVIFAPFWRQAGHVGNNRVDRFVRWLAADGYRVVVIRAGSSDAIRDESWGEEITVRDPLGLYRDAQSGTTVTANPRKPNKWRRALAYWLFNPDPTVVWARSAARNPTVVAAMEGASFILSSSPPESAHVGAWILSRKTSVPHIVDMRDGWLDEPLKTLLRSSALRRWQEGRLESRILHAARAIQVTSDVWQGLLCSRYPKLTAKIHVLTNGYPHNMPAPQSLPEKKTDDEYVLIHAGRFSGSDTRRTPDILLNPLLQCLSSESHRGVVRLIGPLTEAELAFIEPFNAKFAEVGWRIECPGNMPRDQLLELLPKADGLLLLSASYAAIPSKLFEYIPTGRPIFVVTEKDSATWRVCEPLAQAVLVEAGRVTGKDNKVPTFFICADQSNKLVKPSIVPINYSETSLRQKFLQLLG